MDVKLIAALDRTLENWFQGEMALAFAEPGTEYKIFSSYDYNHYYEKEDDDDDKNGWYKGDWEELIEDSGIVTIEGKIFNKIKVSKWKSTGERREVDFLLENSSEYVFSEIKVLWFDKNKVPKNVLYSYLEKNNVLDDAQRLKKHLQRDYKNDGKNLLLYLTLICIGDIENEQEMKDNLASVLNEYLEGDSLVTTDQIRTDKISGDDPEHLERIAGNYKNGDFDYLNNIFLITVALGE